MTNILYYDQTLPNVGVLRHGPDWNVNQFGQKPFNFPQSHVSSLFLNDSLLFLFFQLYMSEVNDT